ncbi:MAG: hypothetical protein QM669_00475 [Siphonobacter sp.]
MENLIYIQETNLVELDEQDLKSIQGGLHWLVQALVGYAVCEVIDGIAQGLAEPCKK